MMYETILSIVGLTVVLFLPGFFISKVLFPNLRHIDRLIMSVGFSIAAVALLALSLGTIGRWSPAIVWVSFISVVAAGFFIWRVRHAPRARTSGTGRSRTGRSGAR